MSLLTRIPARGGGWRTSRELSWSSLVTRHRTWIAAAFGGAFGIAWNLLWPGSPPGAYALIGAAALLGAAMQAPLASLALALELTHSGFQIMVPMLAATVTATIVSRYIDGYSIYSARLPPQRGGPVRRARPPGRPAPDDDRDGLDTA